MFFKREPQTMRLQKFKLFFTTVDNTNHEGTNKYKWGDCENLLCSVPEHLMIGVKHDGYIKDTKGEMYPLANVLSIRWELVEEKIVLDSFLYQYKTSFSDEEVERMKIS